MAFGDAINRTIRDRAEERQKDIDALVIKAWNDDKDIVPCHLCGNPVESDDPISICDECIEDGGLQEQIESK